MQEKWEIEPTITLKEAAILFNIGLPKFRVLFRKKLANVVRYFKDRNGYKLLLIDIMRAAFPEADDHTIHMMSLDFLCRLRISRRIKYGGKPIL